MHANNIVCIHDEYMFVAAGCKVYVKKTNELRYVGVTPLFNLHLLSVHVHVYPQTGSMSLSKEFGGVIPYAPPFHSSLILTCNLYYSLSQKCIDTVHMPYYHVTDMKFEY